MTAAVRRFAAQIPDYLVRELNGLGQGSETISATKYQFQTFYHPLICPAIRQLNIGGLDQLFAWAAQNPSNPFLFDASYAPNADVVDTTAEPQENLDFDPSGAYSAYNWELFFHAPFLIAVRLSQNLRFFEARQWFHYIFDPTRPSADQVWRFPPFAKEAQSWAGGLAPTLQSILDVAAAMTAEVAVLMDDPFQPHLLAELPARISAYMKAIVLAYIDNLIAWGDQLFRQNTLESINEATALYVLASELLGARPAPATPPTTVPDGLTFNSLMALAPAQQLTDQDLEDPSIAIENLVPQAANAETSTSTGMDVVSSIAGAVRYFCIPHNDRLLAYWDTVADRLFKIRNSLNIEGALQSLPLFEPPLDPDLLVRAAAAGVDLSSALGDINAPTPIYRFSTMHQRAVDLCADVKALGAALLSALEKQDAEALARLRSGHEVDLLKDIRLVKQKQIDEAQRTKDGIVAYRAVVQARSNYYAGLLTGGTSAKEQDQINNMQTGLGLTAAQATVEYVAAILYLIPQLEIGLTPGTQFGGVNLAGAISSLSAALGATASAVSTQGSLSGIQGGYERRTAEWTQQKSLADLELTQNTAQQAAAQARIDITTQELTNHDKQIDQATEVDDFLRDKFTNDELFGWMSGELSALYFQSYQMAYDLAKRAERAYHFEIGDFDDPNSLTPQSPFIQFGHWDSLRRGLLAGERLHFDLKRMEASYLDRNRRELEITKHVSLAEVDGQQLLTLRETGQCIVTLPEALFDADFPGHYMRRLKTVGLSIPCVTGPYAGVNATLTLLWSRVRITPVLAVDKKKGTVDESAANLMQIVGPVQAVVTSSGQNDSGLFDVNLRDERYLPFEGSGAVSVFRLEVPVDSNTFDRETLTDVILHLRYTARDGGEAFRTAVRTARALDVCYNPLAPKNPPVLEPPARAPRLFSAAHDLASAWFECLYRPPADGQPQTLALPMRAEHFPPPPPTTPGAVVKIKKVTLVLLLQPSARRSYDHLDVRVVAPPTAPGGAATSVPAAGTPATPLLVGTPIPGIPGASFALLQPVALADAGSTAPGWRVQFEQITEALALASTDATAPARLDPSRILDLAVLVDYEYPT